MLSIDNFKLRIAELDRRLRPIADRPVDITKPGWGVRLVQGPLPLEEAGVRTEADLLLNEVIAFYCANTDECRQAIRKLFEENRAWGWAASLPFDPTTDENFRQHLLLFSIRDQGQDCRDALLELQHLCRSARAAGLNTATALKEVAALSSNKNKYGMGSTQKMLLEAADPLTRK